MNYIINKNKKLKKEYDFKYDFLDEFITYIDVNLYYDIYNSFDDTRIKNIYNFIYIKWYLIQNKLKINRSLLKKNIENKDIFNDIIKEFINNDISIAIFIINSTLRYI